MPRNPSATVLPWRGAGEGLLSTLRGPSAPSRSREKGSCAQHHPIFFGIPCANVHHVSPRWEHEPRVISGINQLVDRAACLVAPLSLQELHRGT